MTSPSIPRIPVTGSNSLMEYAKQLGILGKEVSIKEVGHRQQEKFMFKIMKLIPSKTGPRDQVSQNAVQMGLVDLIEFAVEFGILEKDVSLEKTGLRSQEAFYSEGLKLAKAEASSRKDSHGEERSERMLAYMAGELDIGQDVDHDSDSDDFVVNSRTPESSVAGSIKGVASSVAGKGRKTRKPNSSSGSCFKEMCATLGVRVSRDVNSVSQLSHVELTKLAASQNAYVGCVSFGHDDPRNHVVAVQKIGKAGTLQFQPLDKGLANESVTYVLTNPQEFFNAGGRFYTSKFYADKKESQLESKPQDMSDVKAGDSFGADILPPVVTRLFAGKSASSAATAAQSGSGSNAPSVPVAVPPPPMSVVDESEYSGVNNVTQGVVRAKRRVVRGLNTFEDGTRVRRNYQVSGTTMFNNVDELYLNIISKDYVQEIVEELFSQWGLPTEQPETMRYAEDLLCAFLIARTASNKADYNAMFDIPTKTGEVTVSFSTFSAILADKYGLTRRNFSRGIADELRSYLDRPENQLVKSRSAQRVGADPQFGHLCFDGSTGCTNVTSSEMTFCRLLEGRNLYERDDLVAEGASEKLMQGIHGSVRSVVQR